MPWFISAFVSGIGAVATIVGFCGGNTWLAITNLIFAVLNGVIAVINFKEQNKWGK